MIVLSIEDKPPLRKIGHLFANRFGRVARHVKRLFIERALPFRNRFNCLTFHPGPDMPFGRPGSRQLAHFVNNGRSRLEDGSLSPVWLPNFTDNPFGMMYSRIV